MQMTKPMMRRTGGLAAPVPPGRTSTPMTRMTSAFLSSLGPAWRPASSPATSTRVSSRQDGTPQRTSDGTPQPPNGRASAPPRRLDSEAMKTKLYWEGFAKTAVKEWLAEPPDTRREKEMMFSAKCGHQRTASRRKSVESVSSGTDISMLSTSTYKHPTFTPKKKRTGKRRTPKPKPEPVKTDWAKLSKGRAGMLDRLIQKDSGGMHAIGIVFKLIVTNLKLLLPSRKLYDIYLGKKCMQQTQFLCFIIFS